MMHTVDSITNSKVVGHLGMKLAPYLVAGERGTCYLRPLPQARGNHYMGQVNAFVGAGPAEQFQRSGGAIAYDFIRHSVAFSSQYPDCPVYLLLPSEGGGYYKPEFIRLLWKMLDPIETDLNIVPAEVSFYQWLQNENRPETALFGGFFHPLLSDLFMQYNPERVMTQRNPQGRAFGVGLVWLHLKRATKQGVQIRQSIRLEHPTYPHEAVLKHRQQALMQLLAAECMPPSCVQKILRLGGASYEDILRYQQLIQLIWPECPPHEIANHVVMGDLQYLNVPWLMAMAAQYCSKLKTEERILVFDDTDVNKFEVLLLARGDVQ